MKPGTRIIAHALALALLLVLAGCGQKGPLFLPEDAAKAQTGLPSATPDNGAKGEGTNDGTKDKGTKDRGTTDDEPTTDRDQQQPTDNSQ